MIKPSIILREHSGRGNLLTKEFKEARRFNELLEKYGLD